VRELKGFQRVMLASQESRRVQFTIGPDQRRYWSTTARDWILDDSVFDVYVGADSTADTTSTFVVSPVTPGGS
jgi:beta-glucosidase